MGRVPAVRRVGLEPVCGVGARGAPLSREPVCGVGARGAPLSREPCVGRGSSATGQGWASALHCRWAAEAAK